MNIWMRCAAMTGYKSVFIDTAPFIYFLENEDTNTRYFYAVKQFFTDCLTNKARLVTSAVTVEEYMVHPYASGEIEYVHKFEDFINLSDTLIVPIDDTIAHCAARIRAQYKSFKAMDAMQLAAACMLVAAGCSKKEASEAASAGGYICGGRSIAGSI